MGLAKVCLPRLYDLYHRFERRQREAIARHGLTTVGETGPLG